MLIKRAPVMIWYRSVLLMSFRTTLPTHGFTNPANYVQIDSEKLHKQSKTKQGQTIRIFYWMICFLYDLMMNGAFLDGNYFQKNNRFGKFVYQSIQQLYILYNEMRLHAFRRKRIFSHISD